MSIITLTSDLGNRDHYVGIVKGELMRAIPSAQIIDVSHELEPFNILHGAFVLKNSYQHFPEGTIHLVGVNTFHATETPTLIIHHAKSFFVGPDNGLFSLVWNEAMPKEIFRVRLSEEESLSTLPMKDVYVRAAAHIVSGKKMEDIAEKVTSIVPGMAGNPIISENFVKGSVIYFDRFGNAIVNIRKEEFEKTSRGRKLIIHFKRFHDLDHLSKNYSDVEESEMLCLFNSSGYLEIAINKGNAKSLLNLSSGDAVQIEFHS